ncbi:hypothetical protein KAF80_28300 [Bacillus sp. WL1]|uniref:ABC-three component system middle component 1 n=1 Tax=Bacillus sp. WL1 TaxID=2822693 RepID=UPI001B3401CB|nr:ABC-three component system middle component 1 [Bacillus sp. WL1]MBP3972798.1 hypothetical protein [Bacillus sp. WL1]
MKTETVINFLQERNFEQYQLESDIMNQIEDFNIDIWSNESKLVMLKEYRTKNSLLEWKKEDQACIASVLQYVPKKYINNLYFFMVLDFNSDEVELRLEINKIEKNELICKKYILKDQEDLNRVPFLMNVVIESDAFAFDEKFKERIMKFKDEMDGGKDLNIEIVMDDYFNNYLNNKQDFKVKITDLVEMGD